MKYKFFEHTADAKFQAYGATLEEAFANAGLAMYSIVVDTEQVKPAFEEQIRVDGSDLNALLYNFLEELLFLFDTKGFLLKEIAKITIEKQEQYVLTAVARGDLHLDQYAITGEVKAVTYNEMEVTESEGTFTVQVVVDL
jgi:SHS2 domain-containing protein